MPRNTTKQLSKAKQLTRAPNNPKTTLHNRSRVGQRVEKEREENRTYSNDKNENENENENGSQNENENENENEDVEDNEYEDDGNDSETEDEDETVENRYKEEHRQPPKRPSAKHREIIIGNKTRRELVGTNSNL
jgi:hypothetical protein